MALRKQQEAFVNYYLQKWDGAEAARLAGYSTRTARQQASRLLTNVDIQAAIKERLEALKMGADEVLVRLTEQARGNMADFLGVSDRGQPALVLDQADKLHLIKKLRITTRRAEKYDETSVEIELYDAQTAAIQIGKMHALFTDKVKVEDWRSEAIRDIRAGRIEFGALAEAFNDESLAAELFRAAGVPVETGAGAAADGD